MSSYKYDFGNGETIEFHSCGFNDQWHSVPGIYMFVRPNGSQWTVLYVGQTDDFSKRIPSHERFRDALSLGSTEIHAAIVQSAATRDEYEKLLIQRFQPPMNSLLR